MYYNFITWAKPGAGYYLSNYDNLTLQNEISHGLIVEIYLPTTTKLYLPIRKCFNKQFVLEKQGKNIETDKKYITFINMAYWLITFVGYGLSLKELWMVKLKKTFMKIILIVV